MLRLRSSEEGVSLKSAQVCTVSESGIDLVAEVKVTLDFQRFERFYGQLGSESDCCCCHAGVIFDEVRLMAFFERGAEAALRLMGLQVESGEEVELAQWEVLPGEAKLADEMMLKRVHSMQLQQLVFRGSDVGGNKDWIAESLATVNELRERHGAAPLQWCPRAAAEARKEADMLAVACDSPTASTNSLLRSFDQAKLDEAFVRGFGQSVHYPGKWKFGEVHSAKQALKNWYEQQFSAGYDFSKPGKIPGTEDFTQLVWESTTHIGINCDSKGQGFIVACYSPPGNASGQFSDNVSPSNGRKTVELTLKEFKTRFHAFDPDGHNFLTYSELAQMLRTLDHSFSLEEIKFVQTHMDRDGNGKICFHEFLDWCFSESS